MSIVIAGGGIAGLGVAEALRTLGHAAAITIVSDEHVAPYDRPPLSKQVLAGEAPADAPLRDRPWYAAHDIALSLGDPVVAIGAREVRLASGAALGFETLVLATGARARRLPILDDAGIDAHYLRTAADAVRLKSAIRPSAHIVIVGGGVIGLEVAATVTALGGSATIVEAGRRLLHRAVSPRASAFLAEYHRAAGIELLFDETILSATARPEGGAILELGRAGARRADVVLVGIGAQPNMELAAAAGLAVDNGIVVDADGRTSRPDIFAVGDVVTFPCGFHGRMIRLEQWQSAIEQAQAAARAIMGQPRVPSAVPWFWSDQHLLSLQVVGRTDGDEEVERIERDGRILLHVDRGVLVGATLLNAAHLRRPLTALVTARVSLPGDLLGDPATDLRALAKGVA